MLVQIIIQVLVWLAALVLLLGFIWFCYLWRRSISDCWVSCRTPGSCLRRVFCFCCPGKKAQAETTDVEEGNPEDQDGGFSRLPNMSRMGNARGSGPLLDSGRRVFLGSERASVTANDG